MSNKQLKICRGLYKTCWFVDLDLFRGYRGVSYEFETILITIFLVD